MIMKGFLLTLDGLLALSLVIFGGWFVVTSVFDLTPFTTNWFLAAHDLAGSLDQNSVSQAPELKMYTTPAGEFRIRGVAYKYPIVCEGTKNVRDACFSENDAMLAGSRFEVWVGPR